MCAATYWREEKPLPRRSWRIAREGNPGSGLRRTMDKREGCRRTDKARRGREKRPSTFLALEVFHTARSIDVATKRPQARRRHCFENIGFIPKPRQASQTSISHCDILAGLVQRRRCYRPEAARMTAVAILRALVTRVHIVISRPSGILVAGCMLTVWSRTGCRSQ